MPIRGGDPRFADFCNQLEERIEALEEALGKSKKGAMTPSKVEKIVDAAIEAAADDQKAEEQKAHDQKWSGGVPKR